MVDFGIAGLLGQGSAGRQGDGDARIHGARTGAGARLRPPQRHLLAGGDGLRDAGGRGPPAGERRGRDPGHAGRRAARPDQRAADRADPREDRSAHHAHAREGRRAAGPRTWPRWRRASSRPSSRRASRPPGTRSSPFRPWIPTGPPASPAGCRPSRAAPGLYLAVASSVAALSVTLAIFFATRDSETPRAGPPHPPGLLERAQRRRAPGARQCRRPRRGEPPPPGGADAVATVPPAAAPRRAVPPAAGPPSAAHAAARRGRRPPRPAGCPRPAAEPPPPRACRHRSAAAGGAAAAAAEPAAPARLPRIPAGRGSTSTAATAALTAGRVAQAENEFTPAVARRSPEPEAFVGLADAQFENANYKAALASARRAIRLKYPGFKPYVLAGHAHMKRGEFRRRSRPTPTPPGSRPTIRPSRSTSSRPGARWAARPRAGLHPLSRDPTATVAGGQGPP